MDTIVENALNSEKSQNYEGDILSNIGKIFRNPFITMLNQLKNKKTP